MKFVALKNPSQLVLAGITVAVDQVDNSLSTVTLTDEEGQIVRFAMRSYSMQVEVPAPPKMVKRHRVEGAVLGLSVSLTFDSLRAANDAVDHYSREVNSDLVALTVTEIEVPEEEAEANPASESLLPF